MTRKDAIASYRDLVVKKRFYKVWIAVLSHPNHYIASDDVDGGAQGGVVATMRTRTVPMGNHNDYGHAHDITQRSAPLAFRNVSWVHIRQRIRTALHPLTHGAWSGLPLLAYISHIIWQCRPLEEFFDYEYDYGHSDQYHPHHYHSTFNMTTILASDSIIQESLRMDRHGATGAGGRHRGRSSSSGYNHESYRYHRVLLVLISTSVGLHLLVTHLIKVFLNRMKDEENFNRNRRGRGGGGDDDSSSDSDDDFETDGSGSSTNQSLNPNMQRVLDHAMDNGMCTLTPLCTSLVVIYSEYFPSTSISILPFFVNTTRIGITSSLWGYVFSYTILAVLSHRSYPLLGVIYGNISAWLWTKGLTTFLADEYWGHWFVGVVTLFFAISVKVEYLSAVRMSGSGANNGSSTGSSAGGGSRLVDWFPCIEGVAWDENGRIRHEE